MAKSKKVDIVIGAKDEASKTFAKVRGAINKIKGSFTEINQGAELFNKIMRKVQQAYDFAKVGASYEKTSFAFNQMTKAVGADADTLLVKMRDLTGGTISDFELMQKAAKATTLGIPIDKVGEFAEIARAAAAAMGESTSFMFDSIVTGTARQSKLILDNLGIIIDMGKVYQAETKRLGHALSETEKKQAFMNAVIEQGQGIIGNIGDTSALASEKFERFEASLENIKTMMATKVMPIVLSFIEGWTEFFTIMDMIEKPLIVTKENFDAQTDAMSSMQTELDKLIEGNQKYAEQLAAGEITGNAFVWMTKASSIEINELEGNIGKISHAMKVYTGDIEGSTRATEAAIVVNEEWIQKQNQMAVAVFERLAKEATERNKRTEEQAEKEGELWANRIEIINKVYDAEQEILEDRLDTILLTETEASAIRTREEAKRMMASKKHTALDVKNFVDAENRKIAMANQMENMVTAGFGRLTNAMVDMILGGQVDLKSIFKNMAGDFLRLFITQILSDVKLALVAKLISMLKLFDVRANDLMAIQIGRDYAKFFQQGVFEGMDFGGLAGGMARGVMPQIGGGAVQIGAAVPAAGVTININTVIGEEGWVKDNLIPIIEDSIANKETATLGTDDEWLT